MSFLSSVGGVLGQQGASGPTFFGNYSMYREVWAEDPSWTNPGDGNSLTTTRDNGSLAVDLTAGTTGGGTGPTYQATGTINSKPAFEFHAASETVGGYLDAATGSNSSIITVGAVAKFDAAASSYFMDSSSGTTGSRVAYGQLSGGTWRLYNNGGLFAGGGTADTAAHLHVGFYQTNDMEIWVDGTSVATDTSGTAQTSVGMVLGGNSSQTNQLMDGTICYAFMYSGDLTAASGFSAWANSIANYYGLTEGW